jgi:hypothetical protein
MFSSSPINPAFVPHNTLVERKNITNNTNIAIFNNLNSTVDGDYSIICKLATTSANSFIYTYVNEDTTNTNYSAQTIQAYTTVVETSKVAYPKAGYIMNGYESIIKLNIHIISGRVIIFAHCFRFDGTNMFFELSDSIYLTTIPEIRSLSIASEIAGQIKAGSIITLYKEY